MPVPSSNLGRRTVGAATRIAFVALGFSLASLACSTAKRAPDRSCPSPAQCKSECEVGALGSCTRLARWMVVGSGTKKDVRAAVQLLQRACANDEAFACTTLSGYYRSGIGVRRDRTKADELATKAVGRYEIECKAGDADSCFALMGARRSGPSQLRDPSAVESLEMRTIELASRECGPSRPGSCRVLAYAIEGLGPRGMNRPDSIAYLDKACDGGAPTACLSRATQKLNKVGGAFDESAAAAYTERGLSLLAKDCDAGVADRCTQLGVTVALNPQLVKDPQRGPAAYLKGCDLGDALGCAHAAFAEGQRDAKRGWELELQALGMFTVLCEEGWASSCVELSSRILLRIEGDRGIAQDHPAYLAAYNRAMALYDRDCDAGDVNACRSLGDETSERSRFSGKIGADLGKAKSAYTRACELGDEYSCPKGKVITAEPVPAPPASVPIPRLYATAPPPVPQFINEPAPPKPTDAGAPVGDASTPRGDGGAAASDAAAPR